MLRAIARTIINPLRRAKRALTMVRARREGRIARVERTHCWCGTSVGAATPFEDYRRCTNCGSYVNVHPPAPHEMKRIYSFGAYWQRRQALKGHPTIEDRSANDVRDGRVDFWLGFIEKFQHPPGRVIEVGCAHGILLQKLRAAGYECIGVEPDAKTARWTASRTQLDIRAGFFPGPDLPDCNLFLAFDVIEHTPDPLAFIGEAARLLRPGGIIILQTPIDRYAYDPPFGEKATAAFDSVEHLFLFSNQAMQQLARRTGLEVVDESSRWRLHHELCVFRKLESAK